MSLCRSNRRIAIVSYINSHGGSIKMLAWVANILSVNYDVDFINMSGSLLFYQLSDNVKQIIIDATRKRRELANVLRNQRYDLVINFGDHAIYELVFLKFIYRYKVYVSYRASTHPHMRPQDYFRLNVVFAFCDGIVLQTKEIATYFDKGLTHKIKKIIIPNPNVIRNDTIWENRENRRIICIARISMRQKRQDLLLKAMKTVIKKYPDARLELYGEGADHYLEKLYQMINNLQLTNNVFYKGITDDVYKVLKDSDLQVLCSDYEGIPNALVEGINVGIPIITTDFLGGGARLLLGENSEGGCIVKRNSDEELANAILDYFDNREKAVKKTIVAKNNLRENFSEEKVSIMWRSLVENALI